MSKMYAHDKNLSENESSARKLTELAESWNDAEKLLCIEEKRA